MGAPERLPGQPKTRKLDIFPHGENGSTFVYTDKSGKNRNTQFFHVPAIRSTRSPIEKPSTVQKR